MDDSDNKEKLPSMSLGDHLDELRTRLMLTIAGLVIGLIICLFFGKFFIGILETPYNKVIDGAASSTNLQTIQPAEGFLVYIKVCLFFGLLLSSPWVFGQAWLFVSSGLYRRERKFVHVVAPISALLFVGGAIFFLKVIAPLAIGFFVKFNEALSLLSNWTFQSYINMILILTLVFGLGFQMPIAIVFAEKIGLVKVKALTSSRKFVILGLVIIAAIVTPPDVISQIALAVPLYVLYEASILVCRISRKRKK